jgi:HAD superfamily hydrolase (TIGR01509 family)
MLIFDCDGVLVDSEVLEHTVDAELLGSLGYVCDTQQLLDRFLGVSRRDMYKILFNELGWAMPPGLLEERERRVWHRCASDLKRVPGVEAALDALFAIPKCVASSSLPDKLEMKLAATELSSHFAPHLYSTALVANGKPAPDIYLHAARVTGWEPRACIVIEDSPHGIAGAQAAGMTAIGFCGGSHAKENLGSVLMDAGAKVVVRHMRDLSAAIQSLVK